MCARVCVNSCNSAASVCLTTSIYPPSWWPCDLLSVCMCEQKQQALPPCLPHLSPSCSAEWLAVKWWSPVDSCIQADSRKQLPWKQGSESWLICLNWIPISGSGCPDPAQDLLPTSPARANQSWIATLTTGDTLSTFISNKSLISVYKCFREMKTFKAHLHQESNVKAWFSEHPTTRPK